jgi:hypothetical protein
MLVDLERQNPGMVFYIAPAFSDVDGLNDAYQAKSVVARSLLFSPKDIGPLPDDEKHQIAFKSASDQHAWLLSEPRKINAHNGSSVLMALSETGRFHRPRLQSSLNLEDLAGAMRAIITERLGREALDMPGQFLDPDQRGSANVTEISYLARVYFGCELFTVARSPR